MPEDTDASRNERLVEILYELKRTRQEGLTAHVVEVGRRILRLEDALIKVLEAITGNRLAPPLLPKEKARRIERFLGALKEAPDIEMENWQYERDVKGFSNLSIKTKHELPSEPERGSFWLSIKFPTQPSATLKEALTSKGFKFWENETEAHGMGGDWLAELAEQIVIEEGEIALPKRKGKFDPYR